MSGATRKRTPAEQETYMEAQGQARSLAAAGRVEDAANKIVKNHEQWCTCGVPMTYEEALPLAESMRDENVPEFWERAKEQLDKRGE